MKKSNPIELSLSLEEKEKIKLEKMLNKEAEDEELINGLPAMLQQ